MLREIRQSFRPGSRRPASAAPSQIISQCRLTLCGGAILMLIGRNPRLPAVVAAIDSSLTMLMAMGGCGF